MPFFPYAELLLESRAGPGCERELLYTSLLKLYSRHRMIDMAIKLSRRHREEQLKTPEFFELLGELIESQCNSAQPQQSVVGQPPEQTLSPPAPGLLLPLPLEQQQPSFIQAFQYNPFFNQYLPFTPAAGPSPATPASAGPPMAMPCGLFTPPEQPQQQESLPPPPSQYQYYYPIPQPAAAALYPTPPQSEISTSPPLYPPTPETPDLMSMASDATATATLIGGGMGLPPPLLEYYHHHNHPPLPFHHHIAEPGYLHRQLKRAVANGDAAEGLAMYLALEKAGKLVNVTESSSLIEQLVRADMTHEATQITQTMLLRNTHPLPKIFR